MAKKTPWFPGSIKPVRNGTYLVKGSFCNRECGDGHLFKFNGYWVFDSPSVGWDSSDFPNLKWRGLAENPNG